MAAFPSGRNSLDDVTNFVSGIGQKKQNSKSCVSSFQGGAFDNLSEEVIHRAFPDLGIDERLREWTVDWPLGYNNLQDDIGVTANRAVLSPNQFQYRSHRTYEYATQAATDLYLRTKYLFRHLTQSDLPALGDFGKL